MRKHGFQLPLNIYQILTFCIYTGTALVYYIIVLGVFPLYQKVIFAVIFSTLFIFSGIFYFLVAIADPSDYGKVAQTEQSFCNVCNDIRSVHSKHCARCNRCTLYFDHHCKWVNNCVGQQNYRSFICLIVSTMELTGYFAGFSLFSTVIMVEKDSFKVYEVVITLIFVFICFCAFGFLIHLTVLHWYLYCEGISTYDLILRKRKKIVYSYKDSAQSIPDTLEKVDNSNETTKHKD